MDIFDRLKKDHDKQRDLIARIQETSGDSDQRERLWRELFQELEAHALAEEQVFYAHLMEEPDGTEKARHSVAEHKEMSDVAEELDEMDMSSPGWLTRFKTLGELVIHHVDEEEEEVFVRARKVMDENKEQLARDFDARKAAEIDEAA